MRAAVASEIGAIVARNSFAGAVVAGGSVDDAVAAGALEEVVASRLGVGAAGAESSAAQAPLRRVLTATAAATVHRREDTVES